MPDYHLSDNFVYKNYANTAKIEITSAITGFVVEFPAFLTDFSQTFDATWNTEDVFGRMDPIATYQGTKRTISLGFDVPAGSLDEAIDNLKRCSSLTTMVYPAYSNKGILSKAPLVRVKFANLIVGKVTTLNAGSTEVASVNLANVAGAADALGTGQFDVTGDAATVDFEAAQVFGEAVSTKRGGLLGWIGGLSWKPNLEMGMFTQGAEFFPKVVSISFQFNVLHEETLSQPVIAEQNWPFGD